MKLIVCVIFLALFAGCPQLDQMEEARPGLRIMQAVQGGTDFEVRLVDIDPDMDGLIVYIENPETDAMIPARASSNSAAVMVTREGDEFCITGLPGGMGIVTFTNTAGTRVGELRVFVRNWKRSEVFRNTLEPDLENYPFDENDRSLYDPANYKNTRWAVYRLITDRGFHYEAPDGLSSRTADTRTGGGNGTVHGDRVLETPNRPRHDEPHILYHYDDFLRKNVFAFAMHFEYDGDMVGGYDDRQRLELKTMDNTWPPAEFEKPAAERNPENRMYSNGNGDTFTHRWKFKLPEDFRVSTEFTHIFQLKPEGADNGNPTMTLTARKRSNNEEVMQLIYRGQIREMIGDREVPSVNWYPREVPLQAFRGEWVRVEQTVTYDSPGAFRIKVVRIRDMQVLLEWEYFPEEYNSFRNEDPFVMFRPGNTYIRAKFGFYRRIMHMTPFGLPDPNNPVLEYLDEGDEVRILYADLEMDKWKN